MNETTQRRPRIGETVHDECAGRDAIVTDVRSSGAYVLRPPFGIGGEWTAHDPEQLVALRPDVSAP
ncbi:hypothetical protein [Streptomyces sp. GSL17-113]|uniref:hypothetical protein n=1 Tax=Streptomyces sp. GSL17-113 TaxID=3115365 RepID=UPI002E7701DA|nr:hypothetical protein [Streptomyces sp. GSL17-113]